jgi:hypothetical protein
LIVSNNEQYVVSKNLFNIRQGSVQSPVQCNFQNNVISLITASMVYSDEVKQDQRTMALAVGAQSSFQI